MVKVPSVGAIIRIGNPNMEPSPFSQVHWIVAAILVFVLLVGGGCFWTYMGTADRANDITTEEGVDALGPIIEEAASGTVFILLGIAAVFFGLSLVGGFFWYLAH